MRCVAKADLSTENHELLKQLCKEKSSSGVPLSKEYAHFFKVAIGNQLVENLNQKLKNKLPRAQLFGANSEAMRASVDSLWAAWLLRSPGFEQALAVNTIIITLSLTACSLLTEPVQ